MLSVSGLAAPCFQLYCCVLKAPHMFLSNESTWPRAFTVWHCANAGGLIRPNSKAAIAACEDEGDEICVCKSEAAAQSCQWIEIVILFSEVDDSVRVPNSKHQLIQSAQWRTVYVATLQLGKSAGSDARLIWLQMRRLIRCWSCNDLGCQRRSVEWLVIFVMFRWEWCPAFSWWIPRWFEWWRLGLLQVLVCQISLRHSLVRCQIQNTFWEI